MRYILGATLLILASLFLLGCPKKTPPTGPGPTGTTGAPSAQPGAPGAQPATRGAIVTATLTEYKIALSPATVPAGAVTFNVMNKGKKVHSLAIQGMTEKTGNIDPGKSEMLTVTNLKAGKYTVYCPIDNHEKLGMKATLTVTVPGAAGAKPGTTGTTRTTKTPTGTTGK